MSLDDGFGSDALVKYRSIRASHPEGEPFWRAAADAFGGDLCATKITIFSDRVKLEDEGSDARVTFENPADKCHACPARGYSNGGRDGPAPPKGNCYDTVGKLVGMYDDIASGNIGGII